VPYDCLSATRRIIGAGDQEGAIGDLGFPYRAVLEFDRLRYAFCKVRPIPSEQILPDPRSVLELPEDCRIDPGPEPG